jgi:eukaryotic-like serine/threonine-protein kinase
MGTQPELERNCVRFGVFELNPSAGELRKHGVRVRLQEQPLKLLLCLLEMPGEICTREVLIQRIWPEGTFVDYERGLNSAITRLRQVIGDSADAPRYIETIGRKGYRFIAPVENRSMTPMAPPAREASDDQASQPPQTAIEQPYIRKPVPRRAWPYMAVLALGLAIGGAAGWWRATRPILNPLVRLSIDLEQGMTPAGPGTSLALAPDGGRVAVAVRSDDGTVRLVTRRLDQNHLAPLPGTEGASSPFFSPDGRWIAFFADGKLKKVAAQGGAPLTLADASTFTRGPRARFPAGSWGDDGNIVAMLNPAAGLTRVASAGGSPLAGLKRRDGEVDTWPQVLPGSQAILLTRHKGDYDSANIEVCTFKTGECKTVLTGGFFGRYLTSGHLLYIRRNTLFAVPFDTDRYTVLGTPEPILDDINNRMADWSFDSSRNGSFVYVSQQAEPERSIFWMDHAGRTLPLTSNAGSSSGSPRFSPDGRYLAFSRSVRGQQDIWVLDLNRDAGSRLTAMPGVNDTPVWMPDGSNILFRSADQPKPGIYAVRADGSGEAHRLLESTNPEFPSSVSPDGKRLTIWAGGKIWIAPVQSDGREVSLGKPVLFLQAHFDPTVPGRMAPAFSPDGRWLAYCSNESEQLEVYVVPVGGPGGKWRISTHGGLFPAWARNRRELFFQDFESHQMMVVSFTAAGDSFAAAEPHAWSETRLLELGLAQSYDVAPDGNRLAVVLYSDGAREWKRITKVPFLLNFFDELRRRVPTERK